MKTHTLLPLISFLFFITADAQPLQNAKFFISANEQAPQPTETKCCADSMNFYAKVLGGANFLQNTTIAGNKSTYQVGYIVSGSLGYDWCNYGLRLEAEYAFRKNGISKTHFITEGTSKDGHFQTSSYMANLLWDFPVCSWGCTFWNIRPFIGGGIGYDFERMHASNPRIVFNQKWKQFSWQAMAGFAYPIFHNAEITVEYKFHQGGGHFYNHAVGVGLVYKFGFIN